VNKYTLAPGERKAGLGARPLPAGAKGRPGPEGGDGAGKTTGPARTSRRALHSGA